MSIIGWTSVIGFLPQFGLKLTLSHHGLVIPIGFFMSGSSCWFYSFIVATCHYVSSYYYYYYTACGSYGCWCINRYYNFCDCFHFSAVALSFNLAEWLPPPALIPAETTRGIAGFSPVLQHPPLLKWVQFACCHWGICQLCPGSSTVE